MIELNPYYQCNINVLSSVSKDKLEVHNNHPHNFNVGGWER